MNVTTRRELWSVVDTNGCRIATGLGLHAACERASTHNREHPKRRADIQFNGYSDDGERNPAAST